MDNSIAERASEILAGIPPHVKAAAAAKARTPGEVLQAIEGGIRIVSHNYVQEAQKMKSVIGEKAEWHLIGNLQKNKVKTAVRIFDMLETVDSLRLLEEIENRCAELGLKMPVLVQVNIAGEKTKSGVPPEKAEALLDAAAGFEHVSPQGLMTIEPFAPDPEESRKYFRRMKDLFDRLKSGRPSLKCLSMGMSRTYRIAIEEGAGIVRIGTGIFGDR